ncbi:MAG TPA: efflux RND transporter permease subunit, partial [Thermoanaerobaculia bacterium]
GGGFLFATLKPRDKRPPARDVINRLRPQLAKVTGVAANLNPVQDMRIGGIQSNSSVQYALKSDDPKVLQSAIVKMAQAMKKDPMLTDVDYDQTDTAMRVYLQVDRDAARRLGVTQSTIDSILYDAFGQRQVATIYAGLNQYHVVMEVLPNLADSPDDLEHIYIPASPVSASGATDLSALTNLAGGAATAARAGQAQSQAQAQTQAVVAAATVASSTGARDASTGSAVNTVPLTMIPLSAIAHWGTSQAAGSVSHDDGTPASNLSFNLADNVTLGQASQRVLEIQSTLKLPVSVRGEFTGTAKTAGQTTSTMPILILAAIAVIYIVLGILYESTIHPLTVLSTLPSAGLGAVAALFFLRQQLDLIALIGLILLIGIVKKNAILIIDFALDAERARGLSSLEAIREASLLRFRPILMTTMVAILGALPLAIGFGEGAELRRPLGFTIIGGLIASQLLTLLTTPVVYLALDRFRKRTANEKRLARHHEAGLETA